MALGESRWEGRIAEALGRPIEGACAARPRGTLLLPPLCAGAGAGFGAALAGVIGAGLGGGLGALIGFAIAAWRARRYDPPLAGQMAVVLTESGVELHAMGGLGTRPTGLLLAAAYGEVSELELGEGRLSLRARIGLESGHAVEIEAGKRGVGAGGEVLEALRARTSAAGGSVRTAA